MTSYNFALNMSSVGDEDLEAELEPENTDDELVEPDSEKEARETTKKPLRKDRDDDVLTDTEDAEPVVDASYIKEFSDGNIE